MGKKTYLCRGMHNILVMESKTDLLTNTGAARMPYNF